jgi:hypothetical protein
MTAFQVEPPPPVGVKFCSHLTILFFFGALVAGGGVVRSVGGVCSVAGDDSALVPATAAGVDGPLPFSI